MVSAAVPHTTSKASLEMDATGSLDRCLRPLQGRTNTPTVQADLANAGPQASFLTGHLDPRIALP